jgi:hypothetical protein
MYVSKDTELICEDPTLGPYLQILDQVKKIFQLQAWQNETARFSVSYNTEKVHEVYIPFSKHNVRRDDTYNEWFFQ